MQGEVRPTENGSLHRRLADGGGDVTEGHLKCLSPQRRLEVYATSWSRDLLAACQQQRVALSAAGLNNGPQRITALNDPTFLAVPLHGVQGHSTGLAIDLGLSQHISSDNQEETAIGPNTANGQVIPLASTPITPNNWSVANAISWSSQLPSAPFNGTDNNQRDALRNFLALYAVTRNDGTKGNGIGWDDIGVVNEVARAALFGSGQDGTQNRGLISNVWIGGRINLIQNPYQNMRTVLEHLGIHTGTQRAHNDHFHVDLRRPDRVDLPKNLLADDGAPVQTQAEADAELLAAAQALLDKVQPHLDLEEGEVTMFVMDMPDVPPQYAQVMIVQASQAQQSAGKTDRTIGVCSLVENPMRYSAINGVGPIGAAQIYFRSVEGREVVGPGVVTVLSNPRYGTLEPRADAPGGYLYLPKPGYFGPDRATFLVEMGGKKIRTEYFFNVLDGVADGDYQDKEFCPNGKRWKISLSSDLASDPLASQSPAQWGSFLTGVVPNANVGIADLSGGAVGQTACARPRV